ncbi:hypothetical protein HK096_010249, partial [Nowakowskiella sp. JEL0078]
MTVQENKGHKGVSINPFQNERIISDPEYGRPHKKELLKYSLRGDGPSTKLKYMVTGSLALRNELKSLENSLNSRHSNSLAAAMDVPYIPNSRILQIRPPPKLPPALARQQQDIIKLQNEFKKIEKEEKKFENFLETVDNFDLKFNNSVLIERGQGPFGIPSREKIFLEPENWKSDSNNFEILEAEKDETRILHKSSWLRDAAQ